MSNIDESEIENLIRAITLIRAKIQWKQKKAQPHLAKRIKLGHLPDTASLETYEKIMRKIIFNPESQVYIFRDNNSFYPTITSKIKDNLWLVMFGIDGVIETAFPPSNPEKYLSNSSFVYLGKLKELI